MDSKKVTYFASIVAILVAIVAPTAMAGKHGGNWGNHKNVIVLVPDGCSASIQTAARWYKQHALNDDTPLAVDQMGTTGMCKTYMANSVITGSAAAGTAFACGYKTTVRFLGVGPDPDLAGKEFLTGFDSPLTPYAPIQSVLEAAKLHRKSTGLVATSRITHATPAAYACHIHDRGMDNEIMEHMVYNDVDVVFGGGARHMIPDGDSYTTTFGDVWAGRRSDGENLIDALLGRGYQFVDNRTDMMALTSGRVWGMFDDSHMDPELDRDDFHPTQPSIAEMTGKAIDLLSQNRKGFFLMVEGSQVDWAGHANDPVYMITDFLAFDDAVQIALDFAKSNNDTLVLVFPDHNTGALAIGHQQGPAPGYTETTIEDLVAPIAEASVTVAGLLSMYPDDPTAADVRDTFVTYWGDFWNNMTDAQAEDILAMGGDSYAVSEYISANFTVFGWTTHGHSGEDVPLWSYAGRNCVRPVGLFDNTDMARICAKALGVPLCASNAWIEFDDSVLDMTDPANPVAVIHGLRFPVSKDIVQLGNWTWNLKGVTVWAPESGKVYIPRI